MGRGRQRVLLASLCTALACTTTVSKGPGGLGGVGSSAAPDFEEKMPGIIGVLPPQPPREDAVRPGAAAAIAQMTADLVRAVKGKGYPILEPGQFDVFLVTDVADRQRRGPVPGVDAAFVTLMDREARGAPGTQQLVYRFRLVDLRTTETLWAAECRHRVADTGPPARGTGQPTGPPSPLAADWIHYGRGLGAALAECLPTLPAAPAPQPVPTR